MRPPHEPRLPLLRNGPFFVASGLMKYQSFMDGDSTDEEASEEDHDDQESVDSLMEEEIKAKEKEESCQVRHKDDHIPMTLCGST